MRMTQLPCFEVKSGGSLEGGRWKGDRQQVAERPVVGTWALLLIHFSISVFGSEARKSPSV